MVSLDPILVSELSALLGSANVTTDAGELDARRRDCAPGLAMAERAGTVLPLPGAVAWPTSTPTAAMLYAWASDRGVALVPFGGGGGVCGGAAPLAGCVVVDTKRMARVIDLDEESGLVSVEPGIIGQNLEEHLGARGWTLGHWPSSITVSTVGGFAAARSAGQMSTKYGTFASMVAGLTAVLGDGTVMERRAQPESAAGPDLTGLLLGAEGTLGLITRLDLRIHPKAEATGFSAWRFDGFHQGLRALRAVLRRGVRPAVLRLYDETDTAMSHPDLGGCLLVAMTEGWGPLVDVELTAVAEAAREEGATDLGEDPARHWLEHRHDAGYRLADALKPHGMFGDAVAADTMEIAAPWRDLGRAYDAVRQALGASCDLVACHASHAYSDGACCYFTFGALGDGDEALVRQRHATAWRTALDAALAAGATTTHHHGVGWLRAPWLADELGPGGWSLLCRIKDAADPAGIANPGKLGLGDGAMPEEFSVGVPQGRDQ